MLKNGYHGRNKERRTPTAVTVKDSITLVNVACNQNVKSRGFLINVLSRVEGSGLVVDLTTMSERNVSFAIQTDNEDHHKLGWVKSDLDKFGKVRKFYVPAGIHPDDCTRSFSHKTCR